jgi:hypothetical protein
MRTLNKGTLRALCAFGFTVAVVGITTYAYAVTLTSAGTKAQARALILPALVIQKYSDLSFGSAAPGAKAEVISPRSNQGAGGVKVVGYPNQAYTVFLPTSVDLLAPGQSAERSVKITDFTSYPEVGTGLLGSAGQLENRLGATRNALALDFPSGLYEGNYTLTIAFP